MLFKNKFLLFFVISVGSVIGIVRGEEAKQKWVFRIPQPHFCFASSPRTIPITDPTLITRTVKIYLNAASSHFQVLP